MPYAVDFNDVSTVGLESSPVAAAVAGLRAHEPRYFKNKYDHVFTVEPASNANTTIDWVHRILKGPLSFVCEWPAAGIPLSGAQIDGQSIIDAAARAQTIFPDQVGRESSLGWSSSSVQAVSSSDRLPDPEA